MSEPFVKSRPGFEGPSRRPAGPLTGHDPLAELARLVGKEDPFRQPPLQPGVSNVATFPQLPAPAPVPAPIHDEPAMLATEDDGIGDFHEPGYPDFDAQLRGSLAARAALEARPRDALRFPALSEQAALFEPSLADAHSHDHDGEAPPLNADLWAEGALPQEGEPAGYEPVRAEPAADTGSSRRTIMVLAAVLVLVGGGLGATVLMRGGSGSVGSTAAPPTILASEAPVKVASPDAANGAAPDGNTALLEKSNSDKVDNAKVVTNTEQPADLNQLPKPAAAQPDVAAPASGASANAFPEPRKVKTVLVRPDGSVVGDAAPTPMPQTPAAQPPGGMVMPTSVEHVASAQPETPALPPATPVAKPSTPKSIARVSATPKDGAASGSASGAKQTAAPAHVAKPKAEPKPKPQPKPVAVASAAPPPEAAVPAAEEAPAAAPGTWAVQLAAPPTEGEARNTAAKLQQRFGDQLGDARMSIRKADNKAVYRVRVGNLSQEDARALCGKLQAAGGTCFAVRN